jgi:hypothetical protein
MGYEILVKTSNVYSEKIRFYFPVVVAHNLSAY